MTGPTHDWHVGTDGMELAIRRDESDSVGVHLGHEDIDDAHGTTIITSRLLEMIDTVQPGAVRAYLESESCNECGDDHALLVRGLCQHCTNTPKPATTAIGMSSQAGLDTHRRGKW